MHIGGVILLGAIGLILFAPPRVILQVVVRLGIVVGALAGLLAACALMR